MCNPTLKELLGIVRLIDLLLDGLLPSGLQLGANAPIPSDPSSQLALKFWMNSHQTKGHSASDFPVLDLKALVPIEPTASTDPASHLLFYSAVAYRSLSTAFILTQRSAALRRIESSKNPNTASWLKHYAQPDHWITVGISHLTTSRQHASVPAVQATEVNSEISNLTNPSSSMHLRTWKLSGIVPWVTASTYSDAIVAGACDSKNHQLQYLFLVPTNTPKMVRGPGMDLLALSDSCTDEVHLNDVVVTEGNLLHGPVENVMAASQTAGAGGLQTSALALGLAARATDWIQEQSLQRPSLEIHATHLNERWTHLIHELMKIARNEPTSMHANSLREESNRLVLRATQAAMAIGKGAGFLTTSPISQWAKEAMFFLVWSCPQGIANAHLCEWTDFDR